MRELAGPDQSFWLGGQPSGDLHGWVWSDGSDWDFDSLYDFMYSECVYFSAQHDAWYTYPCNKEAHSVMCEI